MTGGFEILREDGESKGRYVYRDSETGAEAEMSYSKMSAHAMIIDHTGVPDALRGTGAGAALVARAVEDARANGVKITPLCPFAAAQFRKHAEWHDVLG